MFFRIVFVSSTKKKGKLAERAVLTTELHAIIKSLASLVGLSLGVFMDRLCPSLLPDRRQSSHGPVNCLHPRCRRKWKMMVLLCCVIYFEGVFILKTN